MAENAREPGSFSPQVTGAAYIRVSTGKQEELSPDSQKRLILEYARSRRIEIPGEYIFVEHGISGRKADKRPQFQKMIALAKAGRFQVILLWKFSRFARNQEESIVYKSMLRKSGVEVISISEPLSDGPFGSLIERIIEWMDEFYSIRLSGDVTRGMTEKALRGGYQCRPPLGYRIPSHNAVPQIVQEEADIVRLIFHSYVDERMPVSQIVRRLNGAGLCTSRGNPFEKRSVEYILENPCYAGLVRWNRKHDASHTIREPEEWIIRPGSHEPIISAQLYEAAQKLRQREAARPPKRPPETYSHWLGGLIRCSCCGRTLAVSGRRNSGGRLYYSFQCSGYAKGLCPVSHSISVKKAETAVLEAIRAAEGESGGRLLAVKRKQHSDSLLRAQLLSRLERLNQREQRIREAYQSGADTLSEYQENKERLREEREDLNRRLSRGRRQTAAARAKGPMKSALAPGPGLPRGHVFPARSTLPARTSLYFTGDSKTVFREVRKASLERLLLSPDFSVSQKNAALRSVVKEIVFDKKEGRLLIRYLPLCV